MSQSLLHGAKARVEWPGGEKFNLLVGVDSEMLEHQAGHRFKSAAVGVDADRFTLQFGDGLYFWSGDQRSGSYRNVSSHEFHRDTSNPRSDSRAKYRIVVDLGADQRLKSYRRIYPDELPLKPLLLKETSFISYGEGDKWGGEIWKSGPDLICCVHRGAEEKNSEQSPSNLPHRAPPSVRFLPSNLTVVTHYQNRT